MVTKLVELRSLVDQLRARAARVRTEGRISVAVGYTAAYAMRVHEDREAHHTNGRAGYLLDVMREITEELREVFRGAVKAKRTLGQALVVTGLRLQRESQKNVPVDTGNLRNSAYTRLE